MKALETPTDLVNGISLEAFELALEQWPIKAIQVTPSCNNPLGYIMSESHKRVLLALVQRYSVVIIEDDVYGDLAYTYPRPRTIKPYDDDGRVLFCGSFSKVLASGLRIGRMMSGRYADCVLYMKYISIGASALQPQLAIVEFIGNGHYEPHLRRMRVQYQCGHDLTTDWVARYFPEGTHASRPQGGLLFWVELGEAFDTLRLDKALRNRGVQVAVGRIFSAFGKYRDYLRMNYAALPTPVIEQAVRWVGESACKLLESCET